MQKYAFRIPALFLIQEFQTCTIQIVLTWWLSSTLALKIANVIYTFHLSPTSCDQDLGLTKPTMGWYLPHLSGYVTLRGTSRTSRAIKALLSPVPPRHPWLRDISTWAGNLSSCRLAVTLKSTSYDELQCKALWKARWCLPEQIICCHDMSPVVVMGSCGEGVVGRSHPSKCLGGFISSGTFFHLA